MIILIKRKWLWEKNCLLWLNSDILNQMRINWCILLIILIQPERTCLVTFLYGHGVVPAQIENAHRYLRFRALSSSHRCWFGTNISGGNGAFSSQSAFCSRAYFCIGVSAIEITSNGLRSNILPTPSHMRSTSCLDKMSICSGKTYSQFRIHSDTPSKSCKRFMAPVRL